MAFKSLLCGISMSPVVSEDEPSPVARVFVIEWLFEEILKLAIYDGGKEIDISTVNSCKLVNSWWMKNVNMLLDCASSKQDFKKPVIFREGTDNCKKLNTFVRIFGDSPVGTVPPFHLYIWHSPCFNTRAHEGLTCAINSLERCGVGLVELNISMQEASVVVTGRSFRFLDAIDQLILPHLKRVNIMVGGYDDFTSLYSWKDRLELKRLSVKERVKGFFLGQRIGERKQAFMEDLKDLREPLSIWFTQKFVQKILDGSTNLKFLKMEGYYYLNSRKICWPLHLKYLELPQSLQELEFCTNCVTWSVHIDGMMINRSLINLTTLSLEITDIDTDAMARTVFRILSIFCHQLKILNLNSTYYSRKANIEIPVMGVLEELVCGTCTCVASPNLQMFFPRLKEVTCFEHSGDTFLAWMKSNAVVSTVQDACLEFYEECSSDPLINDQINWDKMRYLKLNYPNLVHLAVRFRWAGQQRSVLKCIFEELRELQILEIHLTSHDPSPDNVNANLLGITRQEAASLDQQLERGSEKGNINCEGESSIVNLRELRKLHLSGCFPSGCYLDAFVRFGVTRMPNLVDFTFAEDFVVRDCRLLRKARDRR